MRTGRFLAKAPKDQATHYEPSSPRASLLRSLSPHSSGVRTGSAHQTRDSTRSAASDQMRTATPTTLSAAPAPRNATSRQQTLTLGGNQRSSPAPTRRAPVVKAQTLKNHAREPQANASHERTATRSASRTNESSPHKSQQTTAPRKGKTSHIFCGNNILSPKLRQNGGDMEIGSPSACFRKGFGAGFYQEIDPAHLEGFLVDHTGPYKRYIEQPLYYGDGPVPAGKIRATLSQCRSRGFGVGSVQRAKKILKERKHGTSKA